MRSAILDVGTGLTKAGFAGEEAPREVFRSCVGEPRAHGARATLLGHPTDLVAGDEAYQDRGLLDLHWPVEYGHTTDYIRYENLLYYALYHRLALVPDVTPCLMLEPADQSRQSREKVAEILFESFNTPLAASLNTATATVYASGRTTGLVLDSGAGKTMINAVCDGYALSHAMRPSTVAGNRLTDELFAFLRSRGYPLSVDADWDLVDRIKQSLCRVSTTGVDVGRSDLVHGASPPTSQQPQPSPHVYPGKMDGGAYFELPDNERIFLLEAETGLAERLINPSQALLSEGMAAPEEPPTPTGYSRSNPFSKADVSNPAGWVDVLCEVAAACPSASLRSQLYDSVVLGGGTSMLTDIERRLQRELAERGASGRLTGADAACVPKVVAFPNRATAAWIGGSVWASGVAFPSMCLSKADYYEGGAASVHNYAM